MSVRSIRISEDLETAIRYVAEREHAEQAQSLRKLARMGFEAYVAGQYRAGEVSRRHARADAGKPGAGVDALFGRRCWPAVRLGTLQWSARYR